MYFVKCAKNLKPLCAQNKKVFTQKKSETLLKNLLVNKCTFGEKS